MSTRPSATTLVVRPRAQIFSQTRLVAAALVLPIFAAMFWFAIPRGTWPRVIIALAFVVVVYSAGSLLLRGISIRIGHDGLLERGFFVWENRVPAKRIATALVLDVYRGATTETNRQLFLIDSTGELLLRMRGEFWSNDDIEVVATAFDVPVQRRPDPMTSAKLRTELPDLIFWFERWPWVGGLAIAGAISLMALVLIALMSPDSLVIR